MMINQQAIEIRQGLNPAPVANKTRHVIILLSDGERLREGKKHKNSAENNVVGFFQIFQMGAFEGDWFPR